MSNGVVNRHPTAMPHDCDHSTLRTVASRRFLCPVAVVPCSRLQLLTGRKETLEGAAAGHGGCPFALNFLACAVEDRNSASTSSDNKTAGKRHCLKTILGLRAWWWS